MRPVLDQAFSHLHLKWHILQEEEPLPGNGTIRYFVLSPGREKIGFRLEWPGHSMANVTDTVASSDASYIDEISHVDLLLHDCNLPDSKIELSEMIFHSTTTEVAKLAKKAGVKRLVLIHKNPMGWSLREDLDAARTVFPDIQIAEDFMEIEF